MKILQCRTLLVVRTINSIVMILVSSLLFARDLWDYKDHRVLRYCENLLGLLDFGDFFEYTVTKSADCLATSKKTEMLKKKSPLCIIKLQWKDLLGKEINLFFFSFFNPLQLGKKNVVIPWTVT